MKQHCMEHSATRELIDSMTDEQVAELWFSPVNGCSGERCNEEDMINIYNRAHELSLVIIKALPNRGERLMALNRLQEACFWACAGMRRNHAVNNILQAKQGKRDLADIDIRLNIKEKEDGTTSDK